MKKTTLINATIILLLYCNISKAQQFNSDNYLTMPHGTGTFVLTACERNSTINSTFDLLTSVELNICSSLLRKDQSLDSPLHFSKNVFINYLFLLNDANTRAVDENFELNLKDDNTY